jgi:hypothetical protein
MEIFLLLFLFITLILLPVAASYANLRVHNKREEDVSETEVDEIRRRLAAIVDYENACAEIRRNRELARFHNSLEIMHRRHGNVLVMKEGDGHMTLEDIDTMLYRGSERLN